MQTPITLVLIALTAVVSWLALRHRSLMDRLILWPPAVSRHRQYDRLLSYGFVHADLMHLLFNMITLYFFGRFMEQLITQITGQRWVYLAFYLSALLVSILPSYLKNHGNPNYFSLGASGAVSAILFAFILVQPWQLIFVFFIPVPAIVFAVAYIGYSVWMDRRGGDRINHSAHLAGAAYGVLFMLAMEPRVLGHFLSALTRPSFG